MEPLWWVLWCVICSLGTGGLVYFVVRSYMELLLSKEREELNGVRSALAAQREAIVESLRNAEESARRQAMDDFIADIRIEERHYIREHEMVFMHRKCMVRQERVFFRNIPLTDWVEHEMPIEEGANFEKMAEAAAAFSGRGLIEAGPQQIVRKKLGN